MMDLSKLIGAMAITFTCSQAIAISCGTNFKPIENKATVMTDESGQFRLWKKEDQKSLTYCISNKFRELKPVIEKAMRIATQDWMNHGNIKFIYVPDADESCDARKGPETLFRIELNRSRRYRYAGRAFFPYDERNTITFKKKFVEGNFDSLLRLTRHELGHVLGLRHEHIREENPYRDRCMESDTFSGVTQYDPASVMHYARCGGTGTTELSEGDKLGLSLLYPFPN